LDRHSVGLSVLEDPDGLLNKNEKIFHTPLMFEINEMFTELDTLEYGDDIFTFHWDNHQRSAGLIKENAWLLVHLPYHHLSITHYTIASSSSNSRIDDSAFHDDKEDIGNATMENNVDEFIAFFKELQQEQETNNENNNQDDNKDAEKKEDILPEDS